MNALFYLFVVFFVRIDARLFEGQCRKRPAPVVKPFYPNKYYGIWYEIEWYDDEYPTYDECLQFTYTKTSSCATPEIDFDTKLILQDSRNFTALQIYYGIGVVIDDGKLGTGSGPAPPTIPNYYVLATDYSHYAFVWDCFNVNGTHFNERMWYFDRQPNPRCRPEEVENLIRKYFDEQYIRKTYHGPKCNY